MIYFLVSSDLAVASSIYGLSLIRDPCFLPDHVGPDIMQRIFSSRTLMERVPQLLRCSPNTRLPRNGLQCRALR